MRDKTDGDPNDDTKPIRHRKFDRNGLPSAPYVHGCAVCEAYQRAVSLGQRPTAFVTFPDPSGGGKHTHASPDPGWRSR